MKVTKVSRIQVDPTLVYDITVPGTENFCLSNGAVVHNSKDVADAVCGAYHTMLTRRSSWSGVAEDKDMMAEAESRFAGEDRHDTERY